MSSIGKFGLFPDIDPNLVYSGNWTAEPNPDPEDVSTMNTVHATNTPQSNLSFAFTGSTLFAQATIPAGSGSVNVEFSVDGEPFIPVSVPSGQQATVNTEFIFATLPTTGPHNIVIVYTGDLAGTSFLFGGLLLTSNDASSPALNRAAFVVPPAQDTTSSSLTSTSAFPSTLSTVSPSHQTPGAVVLPVGSSSVSISTEVSIHSSATLMETVPVFITSESGHEVPTNNPSKTSEPPFSTTTININTGTATVSGVDSSSLPVQQIGSSSVEISGTSSTSEPDLAQTTRLFISASTNTGTIRQGTGTPTPLPTGNTPPIISKGSPNSSDATSRHNIHASVLQGSISGSVVLVALIIIGSMWFCCRRRILTRFWVQLDDEESLISRESRSTLISTTPRPFILARIWSAIATAPQKLIGTDGIQHTVREPEIRVIGNGQDLVSHTGRNGITAITIGSRTSSVTITTLVPQYESRSSWASQDFDAREVSISDAPPTYHSDSPDFSLNM